MLSTDSLKSFFARTPVLALLIALLLAEVGVLVYLSIRNTDEENNSPALSYLLHSADVAAERMGLLFIFDPAKRVSTRLEIATRWLNEAATTSASDEDGFYVLARAYADAMSALVEDASQIKNAVGAQEVYRDVFRKLGFHQVLLRAVKKRFLKEPISVTDTARNANMRAQEQLVERMSALPQASESAEMNTSNTEGLLACPDCNVIFISLTTLRKDHMGIYGYDKPTTPHVDEFFKDALKFQNAFAPSAWTLPNAISFFTSLFPYTHGVAVREPFSTPVFANKKILTFAQLLSRSGYRTAAFTGGGDYSRRLSGLDRGFDVYLDELTYRDYNIKDEESDLGGGFLSYVPLRAFVAPAVDWLEKNSGSKFFFFIQGYDAHCPYIPHEPFASRFTAGLSSDADFTHCHWTHEDTDLVRENGQEYWPVQSPNRGSRVEEKLSPSDVVYMTALYDARIAESDLYLDQLFKTIKDLGLEKNTIIILMSEHGEMLGEHGRFMRGGSLRGVLYEPALNFPLLIKHPNIAKPIIIDDMVQTVDLMPTLLLALGVSDPQESLREGAALSFTALGDTASNDYGYAAFLYIPGPQNIFYSRTTTAEAIRSREWKLMKETVFSEVSLIPEPALYKLYHIASDPAEEKNVYETETALAESLKEKLEQWLSRYTAP